MWNMLQTGLYVALWATYLVSESPPSADSSFIHLLQVSEKHTSNVITHSFPSVCLSVSLCGYTCGR